MQLSIVGWKTTKTELFNCNWVCLWDSIINRKRGYTLVVKILRGIMLMKIRIIRHESFCNSVEIKFSKSPLYKDRFPSKSAYVTKLLKKKKTTPYNSNKT